MNIYGIGVDIVQNKRIQDIIFKSYIQNFLKKVLHQKELQQYKNLKLLSMQTQFIASRWAVKQATVKALGRRELIFHEMRIIKNVYGKPFLSLEGETNQTVKKQLKITDVHISLAHEQEYTIAYTLATTLNT